MHPLFEYLARRDLTPRHAAGRIARWNARTLFKFLTETSEIVQASWSATKSPFAFVANSQLSGGIHPCGAPDCRLRHADRLGRFAVLYGDQVTIQNPLPDGVGSSLDWNRMALTGSLFVLWYLKPLIDAGLVAITNPAIHFCDQHLPAIVKSGKMDQLREELERQYTEGVSVSVAHPRGSYSVSGPPSLLDHPTVLSFPLRGKAWRAVQRGSDDGTARVSDSAKRRVVQSIIFPILRDMLHQHVLGAWYNLCYLTDRDVDFLALRHTTEPGLQELSQALAEGLAHSVPTLDQLPLRNLLRLRRDEGEVFAVYRDALARVLRELQPADAGHVRQAFQDAVLPELNKIQALVVNEQGRLRRSATLDLLVGAAAVGVGLFSGLLAPEAGRLLAGLGGGALAGHGVRSLLALPTEPEDKVRDQAYYFLWRARADARLPR